MTPHPALPAVPTGTPALSDPIECGEDLAYNAQRAVELAPGLCRRCDDFHIAHALRRTSKPNNILLDRPKMIELVNRVIASKPGGPIDLLIAGAADTGLLATCAHAALRAGSDVLRRTRFTVLDLCETPLELCRDFARQHDLQLATQAVDIMETAETFAADIFMHHSLFNFVPPDTRAHLLRKFGQWLKPNGKIVYSSSINTPAAVERANRIRAELHGEVQKMVDSGAVRMPEGKERLQARLDNSRDSMTRLYLDDSSDDYFRALFAAGGLHVDSFEHTFSETTTPSGAPYVRERVAAILGRRADG